ncbi:MAG: pyridoxal phosphate-dependent aminotransferase [Deltaproteobacteria bacterium]|nr:pyridoxal phosphate-dependent aminotransferase [Deltaproteobacteria bacterium]
MKIAKRIMDLEESVTLAITAKAKELRASGRDIISFGAGEPDFDTPENIKATAIKAIEDGHTKYTPVSGIVELKDAIIEKFKADNALDYERSEILISCGGKHSFFNLCQSIINPGDEVIVPTPYWVSYPEMVKLAGGIPVVVHTDESTGLKMTVNAFKSAITPKTKAVIINSPSNPTGAVYSRAELTGIVEAAVEAGVLLISDDIYEEITYGDVPFVSVASLSKVARDNTVVLNGVSKTYSMTGWRIGYAAGPKEIISAMTKVQSQSTSNPTSISQWAAVEAIKGTKDEILRRCDEFKKRRDIMVAGLNGIEGVSCMVPSGAFYVFADVSKLYGKSVTDKIIGNSVELSAYLLEDADVAVVPGKAFGDDDHIRLSYACTEDNIKEGLLRIKKALGALS